MVLLIYGSRGAAVEVHDMVIRNGYYDRKYEKVYFVDDFLEEDNFYGTKRFHFDTCSARIDRNGAEFVIAAGEPSVRKLLYERVKYAGYKMTTLIDKTAVVSPTAELKEGCVVYANAVISSDALIRENCFIMFQSIIGHHADVGRDCVICPKATVGGFSKVGEESFMGLGSSMMQHVDIGSHVIVGMGTMVFRSVGDGVTVIGNPARVTKGDKEHKVFSQSKEN